MPRRGRKLNGEGGIRTLGTCEGTHALQACPFDHSGTSPHARLAATLPPRRIRSTHHSLADAVQRRGGDSNPRCRKGIHDFESCRFNRAHAPLRTGLPSTRRHGQSTRAALAPADGATMNRASGARRAARRSDVEGGEQRRRALALDEQEQRRAAEARAHEPRAERTRRAREAHERVGGRRAGAVVGGAAGVRLVEQAPSAGRSPAASAAPRPSHAPPPRARGARARAGRSDRDRPA